MSESKEYYVGNDRKIIKAVTPWGALGIYLKRGRFGLGKSWKFTRMPDGWIVATQDEGRNLERKCFRMREVDYDRKLAKFNNF